MFSRLSLRENVEKAWYQNKWPFFSTSLDRDKRVLEYKGHYKVKILAEIEVRFDIQST